MKWFPLLPTLAILTIIHTNISDYSPRELSIKATVSSKTAKTSFGHFRKRIVSPFITISPPRHSSRVTNTEARFSSIPHVGFVENESDSAQIVNISAYIRERKGNVSSLLDSVFTNITQPGDTFGKDGGGNDDDGWFRGNMRGGSGEWVDDASPKLAALLFVNRSWDVDGTITQLQQTPPLSRESIENDIRKAYGSLKDDFRLLHRNFTVLILKPCVSKVEELLPDRVKEIRSSKFVGWIQAYGSILSFCLRSSTKLLLPIS
eukprot:jgi/Bigna1/67514/fgenesh1_pg.4_\